MSWADWSVPPTRPVVALAAGVAAALTIATLLTLRNVTDWKWLIPSFGASCALVFGVPDSPFARPGSVIGGHLVSSAVGLVVMAVLGHGPAAMAIGVGAAIAAMLISGTMHPPAGGDPLIVIAVSATPMFLLTPVLVGTAAIAAGGKLFRWFAPYHAARRRARLNGTGANVVK